MAKSDFALHTMWNFFKEAAHRHRRRIPGAQVSSVCQLVHMPASHSVIPEDFIWWTWEWSLVLDGFDFYCPQELQFLCSFVSECLQCM